MDALAVAVSVGAAATAAGSRAGEQRPAGWRMGQALTAPLGSSVACTEGAKPSGGLPSAVKGLEGCPRGCVVAGGPSGHEPRGEPRFACCRDPMPPRRRHMMSRGRRLECWRRPLLFFHPFIPTHGAAGGGWPLQDHLPTIMLPFRFRVLGYMAQPAAEQLKMGSGCTVLAQVKPPLVKAGAYRR